MDQGGHLCSLYGSNLRCFLGIEFLLLDLTVIQVVVLHAVFGTSVQRC